jgi:hypothetical protein
MVVERASLKLPVFVYHRSRVGPLVPVIANMRVLLRSARTSAKFPA